MSTPENTNSKKVEFPRIFSARLLSLCPIAIAANGAPPPLANPANADTIVMTGKVTPTPVSAAAPTPGILPIYILSIILYKTFTICANTDGNASCSINFNIFSVPRRLSDFVSI